MTDKTVTGTKKQTKTSYANTFEAIKGHTSSIAQNTTSELKKLTGGLLDQFTGNYQENRENREGYTGEKSGQRAIPKKESNLFSFNEYHENHIVRREIKELTEQIKREIEIIKKADKSLMSEIKDIEKLTVETLPEKPGIYHIRFLEVILSILKLIKAKINESNTWLQAMVTRKKKRGSLFATLSKKKGTQYSLSDELKVTRQTG